MTEKTNLVVALCDSETNLLVALCDREIKLGGCFV